MPGRDELSITRIFQADCRLIDQEVLIRLLYLSGEEHSHLTVPAQEDIGAVERQCMSALRVPIAGIVLPNGELLHRATLQHPEESFEVLLYCSKRRRVWAATQWRAWRSQKSWHLLVSKVLCDWRLSGLLRHTLRK